MQDNNIPKTPNLLNSGQFAWIASNILFFSILFSSLGLWGYNYYTNLQIPQMQNEVKQLEDTLVLASKDTSVIVARILESTSIRPSIHLDELVASFRKTALDAGVFLQGFSVKDDIISSELIARETTNGIDPIETIIAMMKSNATQTTGLSLEPIYSVSGNNTERMTHVSFRILSPHTQNYAQ